MYKTGIIRKIDELGRIVIPKEIRNVLKFRNGSDIEINMYDGKLILEKVNSFESDKNINNILYCFGKELNISIFITTLDEIIDYYLINNKIKTKKLSNEVAELITNRYEGIIAFDNLFTIQKGYLYPLIINGELKGSLIICGNSLSEYSNDVKILIRILKMYLE